MIEQSCLQQMIDLDDRIICVLNRQREICLANQVCLTKWGYAAEKLGGTSLFALIHPLDLPKVARQLQAAFTDTPIERFSYRLRNGQGEYLRLESQGKFIDPGQTGEGYLYVITQLLEEKRTEELNFEDPGELYYSILESMAEGVVVQGADGRICAANRQAQGILGLSLQELINLPSVGQDWDAIHDDGAPFLEREHPAIVALKTGKPCRDVIMGIKKGPRPVLWLTVSSMPFNVKSGELPETVITTFHDITAKKCAEEELLAINERIENIFCSLDEVFWSFDLEHQVLTEISPACKKVLGYPPYAFYGNLQLGENLIYPEDLAKVYQFWDLLLGGKERFCEFRIIDAENQVKWLKCHVIPVKNDQDRLVRLDGVLTDITLQKESQAEVEYGDKLFNALAESAHILLKTGNFDEAIQEALRVLGQAVSVDRVSVFELQQFVDPRPLINEICWQLTYEWAGPQFQARCKEDAWQIRESEFYEMFKELRAGHNVQILSQDLPDSLQQRVLNQQIRSSLNVPIFTQQRLWGLVGFHDCHVGRKWSQQEESVLTTAAAGLGAAFQRRLTEIEIQQSHEQLRESELRYRALMHQSADAIYICDRITWKIEEVNDRFMWMFGYGSDEVLQLTLHDLIDDATEHVKENVRQIIDHHYWWIGNRKYRCKDGTVLDVETVASLVSFQQKQVLRVSVRDLTPRKQAERELKLSETVFQNMSEALLITDSTGKILKVNPGFSSMTGYAPDEVIGKTLCKIKSGIHHPGFYQDIWRHLAKNGHWQGELWDRRKSGEVYVEEMKIRAVKDEEERTTHYVVVLTDITDRKKYETQMTRQAFHDALTGLPNRVFFQKRLLEMIAKNQSSELLAVLFVDLDGFKGINDNYGHDAGDFLLKTVAERIRECVGTDNLAARMGGDEFTILLTCLTNEQEAEYKARRLIQEIGKPVIFKGNTLQVTASIGIAYYPVHGREAEELIKKADQAMYKAKQSGKSCYCCFDSTPN